MHVHDGNKSHGCEVGEMRSREDTPKLKNASPVPVKERDDEEEDETSVSRST